MVSKRFVKPVFLRVLSGMVFLGLVLFSSGCDILLPAGPLPPTATTTQTLTPTATIDWFPATATSTLEPTSTPTPQPTLADRPAGVTEILIDDDFTDQTLWGTRSGEIGNVAFGTDNLTLTPAWQGITLTSLSQHSLAPDFYLELTTQITLCEPDDQFGVMFWQQSAGDYYRLVLTCSGRYRLELAQGGTTSVVIDWDVASRMQPGAPSTNRIGLWVSGGQFRLYINDTFQFESGVAQNREGGLGVFARTVSGGAMTVRVSDLQIYRVRSD